MPRVRSVLVRVATATCVLCACLTAISPHHARAANADVATDFMQGASHNAYAASNPAVPPLALAWNRALPGHASTATSANGRVFVAADTLLYALNASTGKTLWGPVDLGNDAFNSWSNQQLVVSGNALVTLNPAGIRVFDVVTGHELWDTYDSGTYYGWVTAPGDGYLYVDSGVGTQSLRQSDGAVRWTNATAGSAPTVDGSRVFVRSGCDDVALSTTTGAELWRYKGDCYGALEGLTVAAGGRLYVNQLYSQPDLILDEATGAKLGTFVTDADPVIANGLRLTLSGSTITATNVSTNAVAWRANGDGKIVGNVLAVGSTAYAATSSGRLYGFDLSTGSVTATQTLPFPYVANWAVGLSAGSGLLFVPTKNYISAFRNSSTSLGVGPSGVSAPAFAPSAPAAHDAVAFQGDPAHDGRTSSSSLTLPLTQSWDLTLDGAVSYPLIVGDRVFVTTRPANGPAMLHAFSASSGAELWPAVAVTKNSFRATAAYDNNTLYAVDYDGTMTAVNASTGTVRFIKKLAGSYEGSSAYAFTSPPTALSGTVYVQGGGVGGVLFAVNGSTGAIRWAHWVSGGDGASPTIDSGYVYVTSPCNVDRFAISDGSRSWHRNDGCSGGGGLTPTVYQGRLFVMDYAYLNRELGTAAGEFQRAFTSTALPTFSGTRGFFLANGTLRGQDLATGMFQWTFRSTLVYPPLLVDSVLYDLTSSGTIYAIDSKSGATLWSHAGHPATYQDGWTGPDPVTGLAAANGVLVVPEGSHLMCFHGS